MDRASARLKSDEYPTNFESLKSEMQLFNLHPILNPNSFSLVASVGHLQERKPIDNRVAYVISMRAGMGTPKAFMLKRALLTPRGEGGRCPGVSNTLRRGGVW